MHERKFLFCPNIGCDWVRGRYIEPMSPDDPNRYRDELDRAYDAIDSMKDPEYRE